jgi:thiol-disulfide isomerase/thioredoxin
MSTNKQEENKTTGVNVGEHIPQFSLDSSDGRKFTIGKEEKVTVINFWATWCPPCRAEFPELDKFVKKNGEIVQFDSVDIQEDKLKVEAFLKNAKVSFPVLLDQDGAIAKQFRISAIPTTIIVDAKGIIRYRKSGGVTAEELENIIAKW